MRNDAHPEDSTLKYNIFGSLYFEEWAKKNELFIKCLLEKHSTLPPDILSKCQQFGINESVNIGNYFPQVSLNISYNNKAPITQFIDTDQYNSTNPSTSLTQGIAEYTNANFFSDDTVFAAERYSTDHSHYFPYPKRASTDLDAYLSGTKPRETVTDKDGNTYTDIWIRKIKDGETINHFVKPSYLSSFVYALSGEGNLFYRTFYRDEISHEDYAKKLIPRAIGYSAGLINYFFRGQMEVSIAPGGMTVKNTSQETMTSYTDSTGATIGSIAIYYDAYDANDINGKRTLLINYPLTSPLASGDVIFISFTFPADNIKPGRYIVVFYGQLGEEKGAVIGKVTSPIQIYYVSKRGGIYKIYRMDMDGGNQTVVYDNQNPNTLIGKIALSSDGKTLAYTTVTATYPYYNIYLLDLTTNTTKFLTQVNWPSFSPDGTKIAFERDIGSSIQLFVIDIPTGNENQFTNLPGASVASRAAWSPDGNSIAYSKREDGDAECSSLFYPVIYHMDASGNPIGPVTCSVKQPDRFGAYPWNPYGIDGAPAWSPSGTEITFARKRVDGYDQDTGQYMAFKEELFKVNISTGVVTKLTTSDGLTYSELTPAWSSDGKYIAIGSKIDGDFDIWLVDPNGGGYIKNLTDSNTDIDGYPVFGW